ncbi:MAG TPA: HAMP domain-containing sensor histidine kinase [Xanthomonadales bacterium]|nr:HAMP domain-containing sensor histidine kinase [Xanthomonadales bacterium]
MRYRRQLRSRIIVSFLLFGVGLTGLFAATTLGMREWLEEELIESTLQREVDKAVEVNRRNPELGTRIPFSGITGDIKGRHAFAEVPFGRQLDTGVYDISEPDPKTGEQRHYKLAVRKADDFWAFMQYDVTEQRRTRSILTLALFAAVGVFAAISLGVAFWLSRRVLRPVTDLAARVAALDDEPEPLASHYANDEVGQLAAALDDYARRLTELVERDREFNADVSHELRTPLSVIRGATELLLSSDLPDRTRERVRRIERAARQSAELTEALLLLSRGERQGPGEGETSDVATIVDQVVETQRTQLGSKPVEVRVEKQAFPRVAAPASVLAVALSNLIGNAFKYTQQGHVLVRVEADAICVEDTGPGIDPEEAGKLFERGYRGAKAAGKGAGLGLAIVRRLCDLYGWRVRLAPRDGGGAVARLEFE